ncbi:BTB/POZ domain-containing protein At3g05675 [Macadamia integrifolia]|uniref:BTB/POZ domain-containing protein At3g05675 n=1 Tax=Macadamia integrifolia TaxID=60698 RepID=UPI001C52EF60|nr:BTB/POZ domain-containing protein At3g05675 [Macadamia integrifolia]
METSPDKDTRIPSKIGDRATSDVVVRIRTDQARDEWFYCHSHILTENCKYFSERLSENWPTCQILDSRNCVEVYCQESEFNHHVTFLRFLYVVQDDPETDNLHGVRNAIGILQVAFELGCQRLVFACVGYLEAVPWEEAEEEEILRIIPRLGSQAESILARLQPVDPVAIRRIFISSLSFATSSPPESMNDLKCSAQEQLEYMITEDDDAPLVAADDEIKSVVIECIRSLLTRFYGLLESYLCGREEWILQAGKIQTLRSYLSDLSWASQILVKLETMKEFVHSWVEASEKIVKVVENARPDADMLETKLKVIEVVAKVLEAIGYGTVILPTSKRLHMVKLWLPFVRRTKPLVDSVVKNGDDVPPFAIDGELWQSLESAIVSIVLALPSGDQAEILTDWLGTEHVQYPDLTEAFEVWCYRSKVAKRRLALLGSTCGISGSMTLS